MVALRYKSTCPTANPAAGRHSLQWGLAGLRWSRSVLRTWSLPSGGHSEAGSAFLTVKPGDGVLDVRVLWLQNQLRNVSTHKNGYFFGNLQEVLLLSMFPKIHGQEVN